ncbi:MAG: 30S ribosomal protein S12 methylthiotransferase RimO [Acidimicrobiales bacterium]|nr:30S ribosomal protein S12 methylthiotransferase RimO [Acidimicrobiales bacterium]
MPDRYWLSTLGCPKNQVDSDKLAGYLDASGLLPAADAEQADLVVVNTCAFIEAAREESIATILELADARRPGARLVVTGCLAERYGDRLAATLPEVDQVAGFGVGFVTPAGAGVRAATGTLPAPVPLERPRRRAGTGAAPVSRFDLLNLARPRGGTPWAYVKIAEGCDRSCSFCAIPSFRGKQRSRTVEAVVSEVESLGVAEVVLVAQDPASYGRDLGDGAGLTGLLESVASRVARVRVLYVYPSGLTDSFIDAVVATGVPYFDLSLQHAARPLLRRMRRFGDGTRFLERIEAIRRRAPDAALRSSFIVGHPGETEEDHDRLLAFLEEAQLDWAGFFAFSDEEGTPAATMGDRVPEGLVAERLAECSERQDAITTRRRLDLVGRTIEVLVDRPGVARSHREAPEIDGVVSVPDELEVGSLAEVVVTDTVGPDLVAVPVPTRGGEGRGA